MRNENCCYVIKINRLKVLHWKEGERRREGEKKNRKRTRGLGKRKFLVVIIKSTLDINLDKDQNLCYEKNKNL